jgi:dihydroorotate dehydrogenase electron transfer subunit
MTGATVVLNEEVMPGVRLLWLGAPDIARAARPGQFVMLKCGGDTFLRRPLSIHRLNKDRGQIAFLFAVVGRGTAWLASVKPGEKLDLLGPLGRGFEMKSDARRLVLVAGGLGLAPLGFLADEAEARGKEVTLLLGAASSRLLCPVEKLPQVSTCVLSTDDGSTGRKGFVTASLPAYLPQADQVFACGPLPMFRTMSRDASLKDKDVQVSLEVRMACGLGVCYGCTVRTKAGLRQVCKDGPVFRLQDIIWDKMADL